MRKRFIPNDEQRPVVSASPDQAIFVQAGAGSGKTATLSAKMVNAISGADNDGVPLVPGIDHCLMGTFTDNAATEFKERVRSQLNEAGLYSEAAKVDGAYISTIHTTCRRFLADNALDLGIDPEFDLMTEESQRTRSRIESVERAMARIAKSDEFSELVGEYNMMQTGFGGRESGSSIHGMLTRLIEAITLSPAGKDALSFPEGSRESLSKVAKAFEDQVSESLPYFRDLVTGSKKPSNAAISRVEALSDALPVATSISERARDIDIDDLEAMTALCQDIEGVSSQSNRNLLGLQGLRKGFPARDAADAVNARYSHLRAEAHLLRSRILYGKLLALAVSTIGEADRIKDEAGVLDQNDLLRRTYAALMADGSAVAKRYRGRFPLAMMDEFQDTSQQQADIMRALAMGSDGSQADIATLSTVGDTQQSIYRFRGANVDIMRKERESAEGDPSHMVATMSTNYRSHRDILEFVRAACDNGGRGGGLLPDFVPLTPDPDRPDDFQGMGCRVTLDIGEYNSYDTTMPSKDEARAASATRIAEMFSGFIGECRERGVRRTMALLLGAMTHVGDYASALERAGVPYVIAGGSVFSKRAEVNVIADLLRAIADTGDTEAVYRLMSSDMFCLGDDDLLALHAGTGESGQAVARGLDDGIMSGSWHESVTETRLLDHARRVFLRAVSESGTLPMSVVCENAVRRSGWLDRLSEQSGGGMVVANIMAAIRHVKEIVDDAGLGPVRGAKAFSEWLTEVKEPPAILAGSDENPVQIMTIHASKGLQFSCVAVAEHNPLSRMSYSGLQLSPEAHDTKVTLVPSESDKFDGKGAQKIGGIWENRAKVLRAFSDAKPLLGDDAGEGIAAQTLAWREEARHAEDEEDGRLLYVALTRAEDVLMLSHLVGPASQDDKEAGLLVSSRLVDGLVRGIDAANEELSDDGQSVPPIVPDSPDEVTNRHGLRVGRDMPMRFGRESFGRVTVSTEGGSPLPGRERPKWIPTYDGWDEDDGSGADGDVVVEFVATTDRDDE